ncbi:MAG TPA: fimbrillin family protein [Candidatus Alistipes avicola]|uniref:Fimbrillin family protein n=1 Tax=Candidatus Alistipes avicola TaxID=2838432 RepID=A0A9D2IDY2_9BACT|nr:fimbrillin family protein [uncultured Alistipes sp.]HJA98172.1 fimbrillin family protein [Candidatus Alistipes avicola]
MKKAYFALMAMLLMGGCSKDKVTSTTDKKISIQTTIEEPANIGSPSLNEDGSGNFAPGDTFSLLVFAPDASASQCNYQIGQTTLLWNDLQLNSDAQTVTFSACYPIQALNEGKFAFDLKTAEEKDLLWAYKSGITVGTEAPITLTFKHAMHRLVVRFTEDSEIAVDQIQTNCTAKSSCTVDLMTGTLDNSSSDKATFTENGDEAVFLIVPQQPADVSLEVTAGASSKTFSLGDLASQYEELEGGKQLTVNLTIKEGKITIDGFSIEGWGDQGTIDGGEIIM